MEQSSHKVEPTWRKALALLVFAPLAFILALLVAYFAASTTVGAGLLALVALAGLALAFAGNKVSALKPIATVIAPLPSQSSWRLTAPAIGFLFGIVGAQNKPNYNAPIGPVIDPVPAVAATASPNAPAASAEKSASPPEDPPAPATTEPPAPEPQTEFEKLWDLAKDVDGKVLVQIFAENLGEARYCSDVGACGDEFERAENYKKAKSAAREVRANTWRILFRENSFKRLTALGNGFKLGEFNSKKMSFPVTVQWPTSTPGEQPVNLSPRLPKTRLETQEWIGQKVPLPRWIDFSEVLTEISFETPDEARGFKDDFGHADDISSGYQVVFAVGKAHIDSTPAPPLVRTLAGAGPLIEIKVIARRLVVRGKVYLEEPLLAGQ